MRGKEYKPNHGSSQDNGSPVIVMHTDSFLQTRFGKLLFLSVALLVAVGLAFALVTFVKQRADAKDSVAFVIDDTSYTQKSIESLIAFPQVNGISKNDAAKQAFEMRKLVVAAEKSHVSFTDKELAETAVNIYGKGTLYKDTDAWQQLVVKSSIVSEHLIATPVDAPEVTATGYVYIFPFNDSLLKNDDYTSPDYGNSEVLTADKTYAKEQADLYQKALDNGTMTPVNVLSAVKADDNFGFQKTPGTNLSSKIGGTNQAFGYIPLSDARTYAYTRVTESGVSPVQTGKDFTEGDKQTDSYYFFVYIDKAGESLGWENVQKSLDALKSDYRGLE